MRFTLGTAAKAVGIAKSTISRAVGSGKVSAEQDDGSYLIEASELYRMFGPQLAEKPSIERSATPSATQSNGAEHQFERERALLLDQIRDLRERLTESERDRRALDEERRSAQRTIAALIESRVVPPVADSAASSSPATDSPPQRRRWWQFGRGAVAAIIVAVSSTGAPAGTFFDGAALEARCADEELFCLGYVAGIADAMGSGSRIDRFRACIPEGVPLDQLRDTVTEFLGFEEAKRHLEGARLVAEALQNAFPCR